jgi:hypothetical protein
MSPVRPGWIGPMEWGGLSAGEKAEVAGMDPAEFSEWQAARERQQAVERVERQRHQLAALSQRRFNRLAVVAFVLALLGLAVPFLFMPVLGPAVIIMGVIALRQITDEERGGGLAKWAIGLGALNIVLGILAIVA